MIKKDFVTYFTRRYHHYRSVGQRPSRKCKIVRKPAGVSNYLSRWRGRVVGASNQDRGCHDWSWWTYQACTRQLRASFWGIRSWCRSSQIGRGQGEVWQRNRSRRGHGKESHVLRSRWQRFDAGWRFNRGCVNYRDRVWHSIWMLSRWDMTDWLCPWNRKLFGLIHGANLINPVDLTSISWPKGIRFGWNVLNSA